MSSDTQTLSHAIKPPTAGAQLVGHASKSYLGVVNSLDNARQARLRWYGHIMRTGEEYKAKQTTKMTVRGTLAKLCPIITWADKISLDMNQLERETRMAG